MGLPWKCPFAVVTGLPCPTCGVTRAVRLALHGDFAGATRMHPLWFVVVPAVVVLLVSETLSVARGGTWGSVIERRAVRWGLGVIAVGLLVLWVVRLCGGLGGPVSEG